MAKDRATPRDLDRYAKERAEAWFKAMHPRELVRWKMGQPPQWWRDSHEGREVERLFGGRWSVFRSTAILRAGERHEQIAMGLVAFFVRLRDTNG